jgi:RNA polymerase sigma-70 factor (ECF subfamily)
LNEISPLKRLIYAGTKRQYINLEGSIEMERSTLDIYKQHINTVYRIAFSYMKNSFDAEDAAQETFARLIRSGQTFRSVEKEKAWLVVTVSNVCKDMLRRHYRSDRNIDDYESLSSPEPEIDQTMEAILSLPEKYKTVVYLFYYEGYTAREIARILDEKPNTVSTRISRARLLLRAKLGGTFDD